MGNITHFLLFWPVSRSCISRSFTLYSCSVYCRCFSIRSLCVSFSSSFLLPTSFWGSPSSHSRSSTASIFGNACQFFFGHVLQLLPRVPGARQSLEKCRIPLYAICRHDIGKRIPDMLFEKYSYRQPYDTSTWSYWAIFQLSPKAIEYPCGAFCV